MCSGAAAFCFAYNWLMRLVEAEMTQEPVKFPPHTLFAWAGESILTQAHFPSVSRFSFRTWLIFLARYSLLNSSFGPLRSLSLSPRASDFRLFLVPWPILHGGFDARSRSPSAPSLRAGHSCSRACVSSRPTILQKKRGEWAEGRMIALAWHIEIEMPLGIQQLGQEESLCWW